MQVGEVTVEGVPHRECAGEGERQVGTHPDVLAALAGEEDSGLTVAGRPEADGDIGIREFFRGAVGERAAQPFGEGFQRTCVRCDQTCAGGLRCVEVARGLESDASQALPRARRGKNLGGPLLQVGGGGSAEPHQLGGQGAQALGALIPAVLLQCHVEVAAAETEGADRGAARLIAGAHPRAGLRVDVEGGIGHLHRRVRSIHLQGAWQGRMLKGQNGLDETGSASGRLGVADLRLHRTQSTAGRVVVEHELESGEFGHVAGLGGGAVRFEQFDGRRLVASPLVGAAQGLGLPLGARRVDAGRAAIGGGADAADDRMDRIAVTLGVAEALERQHAHALADDGAVGGIGERPTVTRRRERRRLGKAHVHHHVVEGVDAAGQHQI